VSLVSQAFEKLGMAFRDQPICDFGVDAHVEVIEAGRATGRLLAIQVKAGSSYFREESADGWVFRFNEPHMEYWTKHVLPVILLLADLEKDVIYWQPLNADTVQSTGRDFKVVVPHDQTVTAEARPAFVDLATPVLSSGSSSVVCLEDVSHAQAKRYGVYLVVNGTLSRAEIAAVARRATLEHIGSDYYRDPKVEAVWAETEAHVVWTFVYPTVDDYKHKNAVCKTYWIDPALPANARPAESGGENIGHGIMLTWLDQYSALSRVYSQSQVSKGTFLKESDAVVAKVDSLIQKLSKAMTPDNLDQSTLQGRGLWQELRRDSVAIHHRSEKLSTPPIECQDVDQQVQDLVADGFDLSLMLKDEDVPRRASLKFELQKLLGRLRSTRELWQFERRKM